VRICVPLGALLEGSIEILAAAGLDVAPLRDAGRKLVIEAGGGVTYITTRPSDVPTYVEAGAADLGIAGVDVLRERAPEVVQLLDLRFGACRMVYATVAGDDPTPAALDHLGVVRVATKYPVAATEHFAATGRQVEVVKVNGSVELAPLVGLSHGIVDLVATGRTLRENGLVEREQIFDSSARLIANRAALSLGAQEIGPLVERMSAAVAP
jgi:ATP phosphoribosyltransferase